jgi:hypothetical protein
MSVPGAMMPSVPPFVESLLTQCGETGRLIAAHDWTASLGPIGGWSQTLRTMLGVLLRSPVPMVLLWGPDGRMFYNDGYAAIAGNRHPDLLGAKVCEGWPEAADFNRNVMTVGLGGGTLSYRSQQMTLHRNGEPEQVWLDLDYSPVPDETGHFVGVIAIVVETTQGVLAEQALTTERLQFRSCLNSRRPSWPCCVARNIFSTTATRVICNSSATAT